MLRMPLENAAPVVSDLRLPEALTEIPGKRPEPTPPLE